jgi:hypothetical protein
MQTVFLEDMAVDNFVASSFLMVAIDLYKGVFTAPSWQSFASLACGWALACERHTITTYVWLSGATTVKHFARFSMFLGCPLSTKRWLLWGASIRHGAQLVPEDEVIRVVFDETTKKKAGRHSEGSDRYRNGAGSARQAYRTLHGFNCVLGIIRIPLKRWPGHCLSVPIGLELSLKPKQAQKLGVPYRSRSQLAHDIAGCAAQQVSARHLRSLVDGGYATKDSVRQLPDAPAFQDRYRWRAGIEATMSRLKHQMGLARLRIRRMVAV